MEKENKCPVGSTWYPNLQKCVPDEIMDKIKSGEMRRKHGLDTSSGSRYAWLRDTGESDAEAQYRIYKGRGLI